MKYATVVTAAQDLGVIPHVYHVSPADEDGNPIGLRMGQFAKVRFPSGDDSGCAEADLIGIVMHRLTAIAQDGQHRHYERAIQCLEAAMKHIGETLEVAEVKSDLDLTRLAVGAV